MDLATAKKEAATRSLATKKKVFVNLMEDGTHELTGTAGKTPMLLFVNGSEAPLPEKKSTPVKVEKQKPAKQPTPKSEKQPAKKAAKKVKSKDETVMKKVSKKSAQKITDRAPKGKAAVMTAKQLRAKVLDGETVFNTKGNEISCSAMAANDPAKKLNVVHNSKGYFITR